LVSQARGILNSQIAFFLANDIGTDDWEWRCIRWWCSYVVLSKA
jgi:hypothetical protein